MQPTGQVWTPSGNAEEARHPRLLRVGAVIAAAGVAMLMFAALLAPDTNAERLAYALEVALGGPRPRLVALFTALGTLSLLVGALTAGAGGLVWLTRRGQDHPLRPRSPEEGDSRG